MTKSLLAHISDIAAATGASMIFVYVDALRERQLPLLDLINRPVIYVTRTDEEAQEQQELGHSYLRVPSVRLTRASQVKISIFLALSQRLIKVGDTVIFLSGLSGSGALDTLMVTQVGRESEMFSYFPGGETIPKDIRPEVLFRVIDIASEIGMEGREGKPIGSLFVVGDSERVLSLSRQLVLNPFRGYSPDQRNILDTRLIETVKEFSTIDGAFVVRGDGVVEACGVFLKTASMSAELPQGLGARHHVAAGITAVTESIAVSVSESTGTVTIFSAGGIVTEIEKPRLRARALAI